MNVSLVFPIPASKQQHSPDFPAFHTKKSTHRYKGNAVSIKVVMYSSPQAERGIGVERGREGKASFVTQIPGELGEDVMGGEQTPRE